MIMINALPYFVRRSKVIIIPNCTNLLLHSTTLENSYNSYFVQLLITFYNNFSCFLREEWTQPNNRLQKHFHIFNGILKHHFLYHHLLGTKSKLMLFLKKFVRVTRHKVDSFSNCTHYTTSSLKSDLFEMYVVKQYK